MKHRSLNTENQVSRIAAFARIVRNPLASLVAGLMSKPIRTIPEAKTNLIEGLLSGGILRLARQGVPERLAFKGPLSAGLAPEGMRARGQRSH